MNNCTKFAPFRMKISNIRPPLAPRPLILPFPFNFPPTKCSAFRAHYTVCFCMISITMTLCLFFVKDYIWLIIDQYLIDQCRTRLQFNLFLVTDSLFLRFLLMQDSLLLGLLFMQDSLLLGLLLMQESLLLGLLLMEDSLLLGLLLMQDSLLLGLLLMEDSLLLGLRLTVWRIPSSQNCFLCRCAGFLLVGNNSYVKRIKLI